MPSRGVPFPGWASRDAVSLAVEKIADKKLSALSSKLMIELCCVRPPQSILEHGIACIDKVKSPIGHEAFLKWFQVLLSEFGAPPISGALKGRFTLASKGKSMAFCDDINIMLHFTLTYCSR